MVEERHAGACPLCGVPLKGRERQPSADDVRRHLDGCTWREDDDTAAQRDDDRADREGQPHAVRQPERRVPPGH